MFITPMKGDLNMKQKKPIAILLLLIAVLSVALTGCQFKNQPQQSQLSSNTPISSLTTIPTSNPTPTIIQENANVSNEKTLPKIPEITDTEYFIELFKSFNGYEQLSEEQIHLIIESNEFEIQYNWGKEIGDLEGCLKQEFSGQENINYLKQIIPELNVYADPTTIPTPEPTSTPTPFPTNTPTTEAPKVVEQTTPTPTTKPSENTQSTTNQSYKDNSITNNKKPVTTDNKNKEIDLGSGTKKSFIITVDEKGQNKEITLNNISGDYYDEYGKVFFIPDGLGEIFNSAVATTDEEMFAWTAKYPEASVSYLVDENGNDAGAIIYIPDLSKEAGIAADLDMRGY